MNATQGPVRVGKISRHRADLIAGGAIFMAIMASLVVLFRGGALGSIDSLVAHYPAWELLGQRIRSGELPLWNPHLASGTPLAADLQSGWFYLPVMIGFTLFPLSVAAVFLSTVHLVLAGYGTYGLARVLGIAPAGAALASIAYTLSGWFSYRASCCPADASTAAWLPAVLVTTELALRAEPGSRRIVWRLLAALALAQLVSSWIGPGSYYALIAFAGFLIYRTVIDPPGKPAFRVRFLRLAEHGLVVGFLSIGLAMGGLLPRFQAFRVSGLADGYPIGTPDGWTWFRVGERLLGETTWYAGAVTLALATVALVVLCRRFMTPFWIALVLFSAGLATRQVGPVRDIAYALLPGFESVQQNLPNRILAIAYLGLAILAGGVASEIAMWRPARRDAALIGAVAGGAIAFAVWAHRDTTAITTRTFVILVATFAALTLVIVSPARDRSVLARFVPIVLLLAVSLDAASVGRRQIELHLANGVLSRVDLSTYYDPSPAAAWMQAQSGAPFRFAGIDPTLMSETRVGILLYGRWHGDPVTAAFIVNNRAALLGLEDVQSTNLPPMRLALFDDVLIALNGSVQDYHSAAILSWEALQSPVTRLLNLRYIVVPRVDASGYPPPEAALTGYVEVWADDQVRILENQRALPRAWVVHDLRTVDADTILERIADGSIDPAVTALIAERLPDGYEHGAPSPGDSVTVERKSPERLIVTMTSATPGFLVFSELAHPALRVEIDGERAEIITVNHAYVGVVVPAGEHIITLTYSGAYEKIGLWISIGTVLGIVGYCFWFLVDRKRKRRVHMVSSDNLETVH